MYSKIEEDDFILTFSVTLDFITMKVIINEKNEL